MTFFDYMRKFEDKVVREGVERGCLGKDLSVSIRDGKLTRTFFGQKVDGVICSECVFAIDYYGLVKKSLGFEHEAARLSVELKKQVKSLSVPVVHFASIGIEKVAQLAPDLVADFPKFKKELLDLRGFDHNYQV